MPCSKGSTLGYRIVTSQTLVPGRPSTLRTSSRGEPHGPAAAVDRVRGGVGVRSSIGLRPGTHAHRGYKRTLGVTHRGMLPLRYFDAGGCWREPCTGTSAPAVASCTRRDDRGEGSRTSTRSAQLREVSPSFPVPSSWMFTTSADSFTTVL